MAEDLKKMYRTIMDDHFPPQMEISFVDGKNRQTLVYEKATWVIEGVEKGLRYGENPGQEAALYRLVNGNLMLGQVANIQPGNYLASDIELLQSGKHPGKTNITDADNSLNILRYFTDRPTAVIVKHNNPAGWPGPTAWRRPTTRPTWPTGWPLSAGASPATGRWTGPRPKPSAGSMRKWSWRRSSRRA